MSQASAASNAAAEPGTGLYRRHRPEQTLLYRIVQQRYPAFLAHLAERGTVLPPFVQREFEEYLKCGSCEQVERLAPAQGWQRFLD